MAQRDYSIKIGGDGSGFVFLLFLVLLILKLDPTGDFDTPVEDWSWWLVTLPLWGGLALFLVIALVAGAIAVLVLAFNDWRDKRRRKQWRKKQLERMNNRNNITSGSIGTSRFLDKR